MFRTALQGMFAAAMMLLAPQTTMAQAEEKPRVAVRLPAVGEQVSTGAQRHLDLPELLTEIERSIQATRKFEVVTRNKAMLSAVAEEQEFAKSAASAGNAAHSGQLEAANYLIIPTVRNFVFARSHTAIPNLQSKYNRRDSGRIDVDAQVIDTATGQIKFTFSVSDSFATQPRVVNSSGGVPDKTAYTRMARGVAGKMADQLVDGVFPMLVLRVEGTQVWVNRGQDGGLKEGATLEVFRPGEELIDPYTKESLGSAERKVGTIKVTRINPKFSMAEIAGSSEPLAAMDILRKP